MTSLLIIIGSLFFSLTMIRSGWLYDYGMGFWGPNGHDSIWHLSLINQLLKNVPPNNPVFSGEKLMGYHWGFDLFTALIVKFFHLNLFNVYFRYLPLIFSLLIGFLSYQLIKIISKNKKFAFFFVFLNYFAGSFGWVVTLLRNKNIGGESLFWSMQSVSTLLNPPYAFSLIIILLGLIIWLTKKNTQDYKWAVFVGLIFGLLTGIKIYAAIICGLAFFIYWLFHRNKFNFLLCCFFALESVLIMYLLGIFSNSGQSLVFKPLWFTHSLIESIDKLYLPRLASFRTNLSSQIFSYKLPVLILIEISIFGAFLIGNMGTRFLGFFTLFPKIFTRKIRDIDFLFIAIMVISLFFPLFFVQKGTAWNTIQFFYYFLFISNFYFAEFLSNIKFFPLIFILLLLTIPTTYSTLKDYFGSPPPTAILTNEIKALSFLRDLDDGIVLTYPYDKFKKGNISTPIPIHLYETTAYVSAMTGKSIFLEDEMNMDITGYDWKKRREESVNFFSGSDQFFARGFLLNNEIDYVYLVDNQNFNFSNLEIGVSQIYNDSQIKIYKVQK